MRLVLGQQPLEAEQQRELASPLDRRMLGARVELSQRNLERAPARRTWSECVLDLLAVVDELFAGEVFRPLDVGGSRDWHGHRGR